MRIWTFAVLLVLAGTTARADGQSLAQAAQEAYAKADYQKALVLYDSIATSSTSASLYYNIGNCWSKLGDVPHAVLYYERALRLAPGAEDIQANLDLVRSKVVDRVNELPSFSLGSLWDRIQGGKDVDDWALRSLWACLITALVAALALFIRQRSVKRVMIIIGSVGALATLLMVGLAGQRVQQAESRSEAIVMEPKVDILGEPRSGSTTLFILHEGTKLDVLQEQAGWFEIKLASGAVGWVEAKGVERI